jgi:UDP-N-acetyl-2-amino-2-deoxyglucuronate dehydrogenase
VEGLRDGQPLDRAVTSSAPLRAGIIGGGNISETHARAAQSVEGVEVAAVYGHNAERSAALARAVGATAFTDFERFLASPLDFVIIGSPSGVHAEQGIAAARRGLHVLVEKPLDVTTERADALIDAATAAGVRLAVCFQDRMHPDLARAHALVAGGALGAPILIAGQVRWYRPPEYYAASKWRGTRALDGGGALINQASHTVDLILWLFGPATRVYATAATRLHAIEVEDTVAAVIHFANGAIGTLEAATSAWPGYPRRVTLTGSEGTLVIEHDRLVAGDLRSGEEVVAPRGDADANLSASSATVSDVRGHARLIEDFVESIRTGRRPACDGPEGRRSVALIEAIYESAESGRPVDLIPRI